MAQAFSSALMERNNSLAVIGFNDVVQAETTFSRGLSDSGIVKSALHEVYAAAESDSAAAVGFILLATQLSTTPLTAPRSLLWVRQEYVQLERGAIYPPGLQHLGLNPETIIAISASNTLSALQAGLEGAQCQSLSAVIIEFRGEARAYDITASRRLSFAAKASGVRVFVMRSAIEVVPSAAETRWRLRAAPSIALAANAPGKPRFELTLLRHKGGQEGRLWQEGQRWIMGWNHNAKDFN